jgi:hypothetical protein
MGYKPLHFTDARVCTWLYGICFLLCRNICRNEPVCLCATSSSCEDGITMKRYPVMKSEATPYFLKLRCVHDRPSFLYALTSLMSSFFVCLERVTCPFSLGLNERCTFLYIQAGKHKRDEEGRRETACLALGEKQTVCNFLPVRLCRCYEIRRIAW